MSESREAAERMFQAARADLIEAIHVDIAKAVVELEDWIIGIDPSAAGYDSYVVDVQKDRS